MSAALKYTDRDVRENPNFYGIAVDYLMAYEGEFQFLIDCKMRVAQDIDLTIGMVRGILNCMRMDPRAPQLPEPLVFDADVIPMPERGDWSARPRRSRKTTCELSGPHKHSSDDFKLMHYCPGIPVVVRNFGYSYRRPAKLKDPYIFVKGKSASTVLVHRAMWVEFEWYPVHNDYGWNYPPTMIIHTDCTHPYSLRNGLLATIEDVASPPELYRGRLIRCTDCFSDAEWEAL